jgi:hypothetical protein
MKTMVACLVVTLLCLQTMYAGIARGGGASRVNVQNRSANVNQNRNVNVNRNANVNRNVNVNQNVNVNRDVDVHRTYYGGRYYGGPVVVEDNNWGSFAAGAAVGAVAGAVTTAAVASAGQPSTTAVVTAPALGTTVTALPGTCSQVAAGGAVIYNCANTYYQPFYQGSTLVYQVVRYP